jgi:hypothetical protein
MGGGWVDRADALAPQPAPMPRDQSAGSATAPGGAP